MSDNEPENISFSADSELDFLAELNNDNYKPVSELTAKQLLKQGKDEARQMKQFIMEQERDMKKQQKENERIQKLSLKETKKSLKNEDSDSLFDEKGTPILGKDRILLLKKVKQYKSLFPAELKTFKVKKNPTTKDLSLLKNFGIIDYSYILNSFIKVCVDVVFSFVFGSTHIRRNRNYANHLIFNRATTKHIVLNK